MTSSRAKIFFTVRLRLQIRCDIRTKTARFFCVESRLQRCVVAIVQDEILNTQFFVLRHRRSLVVTSERMRLLREFPIAQATPRYEEPPDRCDRPARHLGRS